MADLYIGLMSGTSLDGVDGVIAAFGPGETIAVRAHRHQGFPASLAAELLALNAPQDNELERAAFAGNALARVYAEVVAELLRAAGARAGDVRAIGAHGQTVRHRPLAVDGTGYTLQLNSPALLAELCGIDVVADLRSRDLAAGGQGAPLVPAFHRAVFGDAGSTRAVLNLGGIANLTLLHADGRTTGFDCGPANALMDHWVRRHRSQPCDTDGAWAAGGRVLPGLLAAFLTEPYFAAPPPKSTGRDLFRPEWLETHLAAAGAIAPQDVQATLAELTAATCAGDLQRHAAGTTELIVCGGGALNRHLMARLAARLPGVPVVTSAERGLPVDQVEACAFAWLARRFVQREPGNLASVTGARGPRVLGALYPAG